MALPRRPRLERFRLQGAAHRSGGWRWERADNPLWERAESRAQKRGTAAHTAILEGLAAYEAAYAVTPERGDHPDALDTADDLKAWLRARELKLTGAKADLIARVLEADPDAPIWSQIEEQALAGPLTEPTEELTNGR